MPDPSLAAAAPKSLDPASIRDRHRMLYRQAQDTRARGEVDPEARETLHRQVDQLMGEMRLLSEEVPTLGGWVDFGWLRAAAADWQEAFGALFHESRDVLEELRMPSPAETSETRARKAPLAYDVILGDVRKMAYELGLRRKEEVLASRIEALREILRDRGRIHRILDSTQSEQEEDWRLALAHFASDVLALRTSLVYQLDEGSWKELARIPLEEVKCLDAYYLSLADPGREPVACYLRACERLRAALRDPAVKAAPADFAALRGFLEVDRRRGGASVLHVAKARMRWRSRERSGQAGSAPGDWSEAGEHLRLFYGNVAGAVAGPRREACMVQALSALRGSWRERRLVSCLEAAIAISFFDPDLVVACAEQVVDIL